MELILSEDGTERVVSSGMTIMHPASSCIQIQLEPHLQMIRGQTMTDKANTYTLIDSNFKVATEAATKYGETIGLPAVLTVKTGGEFPRSSTNTEFGITICDDPTIDKPNKIDIGVLVQSGGTCTILL